MPHFIVFVLFFTLFPATSRLGHPYRTGHPIRTNCNIVINCQ